MRNNHKKLSKTPFRISLFRVSDGGEKHILDKFKKVLKDEFAAFKALGHYDLIIIYKHKKGMIFNGIINNVRAFTNIDCISSPGSDNIINQLRKCRVLSLSLIALNSDGICNNQGIRSDLFNELPKSVLHLNSLTWGEQVILIAEKSMADLYEQFKKCVLGNSTNFMDIHSVVGINMKEVRKIDDRKSKWRETLNSSTKWDIKWIIDFGCRHGANDTIVQAMKKEKEESSEHFSYGEPIYAFSSQIVEYELQADTWREIIRAIRSIRKNASDAFSSTKLIIRSHQENVSGATGQCRPIKCFENIRLGETECENIKNKLGDHVARQVIQSVYCVLDAASDFPSVYAVQSLAPAVRRLISLQIRPDSREGILGNDDERVQTYLSQSEGLMAVTRQRLAGMPMTREFSRLPFELPPPGLRIYYEAAEHTASSFLKKALQWNDDSPYVLIDVVDSPKFQAMAITLPHRHLDDARINVAITHETLHFYLQNREDWNAMLFSRRFKQFYKETKLLSLGSRQSQWELFNLVEDITVESLDFVFSYLEDIEAYIEAEWSCFAKTLNLAVESLIGPQTLFPYVIRTFAVQLQHEARRRLEGKPDYEGKAIQAVLSVPHLVRDSLKRHVENIKTIAKANDLNLNYRFPSDFIVKMRHDVEAMEPLLTEIFKKVNMLKAERAQNLENMKTYKEGVAPGVAGQIFSRQVVFDRITHPHIVINELSKIINHTERKIVENERDAIAKTLMMSLWNTKQRNEATPTGD